MAISGDPIADFNRWDREQRHKEDVFPVCFKCGCTIFQTSAVKYDGEWVCSDCEDDLWGDIRQQFVERVIA